MHVHVKSLEQGTIQVFSLISLSERLKGPVTLGHIFGQPYLTRGHLKGRPVIPVLMRLTSCLFVPLVVPIGGISLPLSRIFLSCQ